MILCGVGGINPTSREGGEFREWLARLYIDGNSEVRQCLVRATLEHLFENPDVNSVLDRVHGLLERSRTSVAPKMLACLIRIVRAAAQLQIINRRTSTLGKRNHVMKLEQSTLSAPSICSDERALTFGAGPYFPLNGRSHMTAVSTGSRTFVWSIDARQFPPLETLQQH